MDHTILSAGEFDMYNVIEKGEDPLKLMNYVLILNELFIEKYIIFRNELDHFKNSKMLFEKFGDLIGEKNRNEFFQYTWEMKKPDVD